MIRRLALMTFGCFALLACSSPQIKDTEPATKDASALGDAGLSYVPGGMWMPEQLPAQAAILKSLGLELDPQALADPNGDPLGAVLWLGGCSASFVSDQGLIVTNHHCASRALQVNSTPENDLTLNGFAATGFADEPSVGSTGRVYVARSFKDVTETLTAGLAELPDDTARYDAIESRTKTLVSACEDGKPELRCRVASTFEGERYTLIEQLQLRDLRLVYAPPEGVGSYGGELDNWMWPRHSGDFAFLRAYVGPDGSPADTSPDNVPYHPEHILKLASKPLQPGDLVFVAGYPYRTYRHKTAFEVEEAIEWSYPRNIALNEAYLELIERTTVGYPETAIKAKPWVLGLGNKLKNNQGMMEGLVNGGLGKDKERLEGELRAWIAESPERVARFGTVLDDLETLQRDHTATRDADAALGELFRMSMLLSTAETVVRTAEERPKPDAERAPDYQERNWSQTRQGFEAMEARYDRRLDVALFGLAMERALSQEGPHQVVLQAFLGARSVREALDAAYQTTTLEAVDERLRLLDTATPESLQASSDPFIQLALALRPARQAVEDRSKEYEGALTQVRPKYLAALRAFHEGDLAPDANATLRITYGTVRGFKTGSMAKSYYPFSFLQEMVAKHTGKEPFDAPDVLLKAAKDGALGPYVVAEKGDVPVDFLSDLDTTGGNSGSPTLNGRGELVGLLFDGNYESMASDWLFMPGVTRSIHTDLRYVLWILDVDRGDRVLRELGIQPALEVE
ncbi:MAG: hypothetical protein AUK47_20590 [Deltaproteobacteria bacterium CG2_30_63_29]|nr:MAG: hypothetical protein AUK47_20590 [Deltaproteobacteria bacterium CG2_30_63_29]